MGNFEYNPPKNTPVSETALLADLRAVAKKIGSAKMSQSVYVRNGGKFNPSTITRRFKTWNLAIAKIGANPGNVNNYSDEDLFENILTIWRHKGTQPVRSDLDSPLSGISQSPYNRRFNSWSEALRRFVSYASETEVRGSDTSDVSAVGRKTGRDPSLRLRFQVLKRDHFACVQCGASPAKNHNVELQVDHVLPWSKGGETELSNLQTLCQKCNSGKSNLL